VVVAFLAEIVLDDLVLQVFEKKMEESPVKAGYDPAVMIYAPNIIGKIVN
jgi:hypothetical protein